MSRLVFQDADKMRDMETKAQKKIIQQYYEDWAGEIGEKAEYYKNKTTSSSYVFERQMKELKKSLQETSKGVSNEIINSTKSSLYIVSDSVVANNVKWLKSLGFKNGAIDVAFSNVPDQIVRRLVNGQIYKSGWSLSKRIWGSNNETLMELYKIQAGGIAQNKSVYEISKDLQKYVNPKAAKNWNLLDKDGRKIYPKDIDYNAQRLSRTLIQHSYQQSFIATTKKNPFISAYYWSANGSRVCPICIARQEQDQFGLGAGVFPKDQLPMDHPNGMCVMEAIVVDDLVDQLADWFNSDSGVFPEIDDFANEIGYNN
jgi:hypothetical protein